MCEKIIDWVAERGVKGFISLIIIILGLSLFISPIYLLMLLFNAKFLCNYNLVLVVISLIVLSSIIFYISIIIIKIINSSVKAGLNLKSQINIAVLNNVIISLCIIIYYLFNNSKVKVNIVCLLLLGMILLLMDVIYIKAQKKS